MFKVTVLATITTDKEKTDRKTGAKSTVGVETRKKLEYLVQAVSVTDSEAKILSYLPKNFKDVVVLASGPTNIIEINGGANGEIDDNDWWIIRFLTEEELDSGKTKMVTTYEMFQGSDIEAVTKKAKNKYTTNDVTVRGITDTQMVVDPELVTIVSL